MMEWVMKLSKSYGQYRVTIPRELIEDIDFDEVLFVRLRKCPGVGILIEEYHGKGKEKGGIQEDQT